MSFSTTSFSSSSCSCNAISDSTNQKSNREAWLKGINQRISLSHRNIHDYINAMVPSSADHPFDPLTFPDPDNAFDSYRPSGDGEINAYAGLIDGLRSLVQPFSKSRRVSFYDTQGSHFGFPFDGFARHHHRTTPSISVSFPGVIIDSKSFEDDPWGKVALAIHVKPADEQDPFDPDHHSKKNNNIITVSCHARNLLVRHGLLAAFVLAIYGDTARIVRYDHSAGRFSPAFNIRSDPAIIQRFLWNFVHPRIGDTVVGCDPTIRTLSPEDVEWTQKALVRAGVDKRSLNEELADVKKARRVQVWDDKTDEEHWYIIYKLIDVKPRLFSRSTMIWKALRDTRADIGDEDATGSMEINIYKEAWRQVDRQPESVFYRRLAGKISEDQQCRLTKLVSGGDLGQREVVQWMTSPFNAGTMSNDERQLWLPKPLVASSHERSPLGPAGAPSPTVECTSIDPVLVAPLKTHNPVPSFSLPYPQHRTFSWKIFNEELLCRERSHMRFVVADVDRPLTEIKSIRELIEAIKGHRLAWEKARVLHKDLRDDNVLISDNTECAFRGFIHYFDYSSMEEELHELPDDEDDDEDSDHLDREDDDDEEDEEDEDEDYDREIERTGTANFIAVDLLRPSMTYVEHVPKHDLESFNWVLLWVLLRHVAYDNTDRRAAQARNQALTFRRNVCDEVFDDPYPWARKLAWLGCSWDREDSYRLKFVNNKPLTKLMSDFRILVRDEGDGYVDNPTYDRVLALFDAALAKEGWPVNDNLKNRASSKPPTTSLALPTPASGPQAVGDRPSSFGQENVPTVVSSPLDTSKNAASSQVYSAPPRKRRINSLDEAPEGREGQGSGTTPNNIKRPKKD